MSAKTISQKTPWLSVVNSMDPKEPTIIHISGFIGDSWWDESSKSEQQFRNELDRIPKGQPVRILVNSEGGIIKDGLGIHAAVKARSADVTTEYVGYACSTSSWCFSGAGKVLAADNAIVMIHESAQGTWGNKRDHSKGVNSLTIHDASISQIISEKTGKKPADVLADMESEKWMTGAEAVEYGLADAILEAKDDTSKNLSTPAFNAPWMTRIPERFNALKAAPNGDTPSATPHATPPVTDAASISDPATAATEEPKQDGKAAVANKQQEEKQMPAENATAAPTATNNDELSRLRNLLETEKRNRVSALVRSKADNKIPNDKLDWWINLAMNDETGTLAQIDALPTNKPGGEPVGSHVTVMDTEVQRITKLNTAAERYAAWKATDWSALMADATARGRRNEVPALPGNPYGFDFNKMPVNSNTYSATLVTAYLLDGSTTILQPKLTALMAFTRDFSTDPYKPKASHVHKYVDATAAVVEDCTDWEPALGDTVDPVSVTMHQESKIFGVSNSDLNSGLRMEDLVRINAAYIARCVIEKATAPITVANFGTLAGTTGAADPLVCTASAFGFSDLTTLRAGIKNANTKNVILDGDYFARITNQPSFYQQAGVMPGGGWKVFGWDFIGENNDWDGAGANIKGFACDPQAILCVAGIPLTPPSVPGNTLQEGRLTIPDVGLTIGAYTWFSLQYRTLRASYDLMFGASAMDKTAGMLLKSA